MPEKVTCKNCLRKLKVYLLNIKKEEDEHILNNNKHLKIVNRKGRLFIESKKFKKGDVVYIKKGNNYNDYNSKFRNMLYKNKIKMKIHGFYIHGDYHNGEILGKAILEFENKKDKKTLRTVNEMKKIIIPHDVLILNYFDLCFYFNFDDIEKVFFDK